MKEQQYKYASSVATKNRVWDAFSLLNVIMLLLVFHDKISHSRPFSWCYNDTTRPCLDQGHLFFFAVAAAKIRNNYRRRNESKPIKRRPQCQQGTV